MQASDIMTAKVVTVSPDTDVEVIARLLLERRISAVPVVDANDQILGIVSEGDLMRRPETETERHRSPVKRPSDRQCAGRRRVPNSRRRRRSHRAAGCER